MDDSKLVEARSRIIGALDFSFEKAKPHIDQLAPLGCKFKLGQRMIHAGQGPIVARYITEAGGLVLYDGKIHDTWPAMGDAATSIAEIGVWAFNVQASAGIKGMKAAKAAAGKSLVIGVTVLTTLETDEVDHVYKTNASDQVLAFARDIREAGLDGIICSPQELGIIATDEKLKGLRKITPGIRPPWAPPGAQVRFTTLADAIKAGADDLVIGNPLFNPPPEIGSTLDAFNRLVDEIASVL